MAVARKCDRCGKYYDEYGNRDAFHRSYVCGIAFVDKKRDKSYSGTDENGFDLCPDCLESVRRFVLEYKKEENK